MTPEERANQLVVRWYSIKGAAKVTHSENIYSQALATMIASAIDVAVAEAVAGVADRLDEVATVCMMGTPDLPLDVNRHIALVLKREANAARSRGEGEG